MGAPEVTPLAAEVALSLDARTASPWRALVEELGPARLSVDGPALAPVAGSTVPERELVVAEATASRVRLVLSAGRMRYLLWVERGDLARRPVANVVLSPTPPTAGASLPGARSLRPGEVGVELAGGAPVSAFKTQAGAVQVEHEAEGFTIYGWLDPGLLGEVWRRTPFDDVAPDRTLAHDTIVFSTPLAGWDGRREGVGSCCDETRIAWAAEGQHTLSVTALGATGVGYTKVDLRTSQARVVGWVPEANVKVEAPTLGLGASGRGSGAEEGPWLELAGDTQVRVRDGEGLFAVAWLATQVHLDDLALHDGWAWVSFATPWGPLPGRVRCPTLEPLQSGGHRCRPAG